MNDIIPSGRAMVVRQSKLESLLSVKLTQEDTVRLTPHLRNYGTLNEILILNGLTVETVKKLLICEMNGKRRTFIIRKLVGRIKSKERNELLAQCAKAP